MFRSVEEVRRIVDMVDRARKCCLTEDQKHTISEEVSEYSTHNVGDQFIYHLQHKFTEAMQENKYALLNEIDQAIKENQKAES